MGSDLSAEKQSAQSDGAPRFGVLKTAVYSLVPAVMLLLSTEALFRVVEIWIPPTPPDVGHGFTRDTPHFVPHPTTWEMMTTNPARNLWPAHKTQFALPKPSGRFRIFALGGSTVHNLKDFNRLRAVLGPELAPGAVLEVINAGTDSFGSCRVRLIAEEIMAYEPDLVFVYSGHNEFWDEEVREVSDLELLWVVKLADRFALSRFFRDRLIERHNDNLRQQYGWSNDNTPQIGPADGWQGSSLTDCMGAYTRNLQAIVAQGHSHGVPVILGVIAFNCFQPENLDENAKNRYEEAYAEGRYTEGMAIAREMLRTHRHHQATDLENGVIRSVAEETGARLLDVESAIRNAEPNGVPGETLFRLGDYIHLNEQGGDILQTTLTPLVREFLKDTGHIQ